jgi:hypothetical protein
VRADVDPAEPDGRRQREEDRVVQQPDRARDPGPGGRRRRVAAGERLPIRPPANHERPHDLDERPAPAATPARPESGLAVPGSARPSRGPRTHLSGHAPVDPARHQAKS